MKTDKQRALSGLIPPIFGSCTVRITLTATILSYNSGLLVTELGQCCCLSLSISEMHGTGVQNYSLQAKLSPLPIFLYSLQASNGFHIFMWLKKISIFHAV